MCVNDGEACIVFGSLRPLNLRLFCGSKTSMRDKLDVWSALPRVIERIVSISVVDNVISLLGAYCYRQCAGVSKRKALVLLTFFKASESCASGCHASSASDWSSLSVIAEAS